MNIRNKIEGLREVWTFDNRLWLTFTKLLFPGEQLHVYRYKGLDFLTDHARGDGRGAREVIALPVYRRYFPIMKFDRPANVLDLGASNGGFPLLLQADGIPLKKVVSVEFNRNTFQRLQFNLIRNMTCEIVPLNAGLCGENKTLHVAPGEGSVSDSIFNNRGNPESEFYDIPGVTLDHLYNTYFDGEIVDICKMDVETAEFDVIKHPEEYQMLTKCRYVIMEIHLGDGRQLEDILRPFEEMGFDRVDPRPGDDPHVYFFSNRELNKG
jgi:FkbM family methyltransferase